MQQGVREVEGDTGLGRLQHEMGSAPPYILRLTPYNVDHYEVASS